MTKHRSTGALAVACLVICLAPRVVLPSPSLSADPKTRSLEHPSPAPSTAVLDDWRKTAEEILQLEYEIDRVVRLLDGRSKDPEIQYLQQSLQSRVDQIQWRRDRLAIAIEKE